MTERDRLKKALFDAIDAANPDGTYADDALALVHERVQALVPHSPIPRPVDAQDKVASPWATLFAQFGPRHTAGKPIVHETTLALQSFNALPKVPVIVRHLEQEIDHRDKHYNNVVTVTPPDGSCEAHVITWGRYDIDAEEPQRYKVGFYQVELRGPEGMADDVLRSTFGLAPDQPLVVTLKPPKLHSDVVYCDDDTRVNFGSMGGMYVLKRLDHAGRSVRFGS